MSPESTSRGATSSEATSPEATSSEAIGTHELRAVRKAPIVLVHGAWGGAWIWQRVLGPLRAAGHAVFAVTLTGDGERAHLRHAGISGATHAADVLGLIAAEELSGVLLVGHSYGGTVITRVAEALLDAAAADPGQPAPLAGLVYVDAMVPLPGESWSSQHTPELIANRLALAAAHDQALPPPDPAAFGLSGADHAWVQRRQVPHPFGMYREPIPYDAERLARVPRWFIDCTTPAYPTIDAMRLRVRALPGWQVRELATGHCPMVSEPAGLVRLLLEAAAGESPQLS